MNQLFSGKGVIQGLSGCFYCCRTLQRAILLWQDCNDSRVMEMAGLFVSMTASCQQTTAAVLGLSLCDNQARILKLMYIKQQMTTNVPF